MARAFIASVPMGIVLVAALVVPLAVIPGTFGFDRWPSSRSERITERQVRLAPPKVEVVKVEPRPAPAVRNVVAVASVDSTPAPRAPVAARAPRRVVLAPAPQKPDPQPRHAPSPPVHENPPPAPAPQPEPQQPSKNDSGLLAGGDTPVARELPPQNPTPTPAPPVTVPAPVEQAVQAPVERVVPSELCHGRGGGGDAGGQQGDGNSQE
jgi:hypothetical protein